MVLLPAGTFRMGSDNGKPDEAPAHQVTVHSFWIDHNDVTVAQFARFVEATGYKMGAEHFGWSEVFDMKTAEWTKCDGADWRHPDGPASTARDDEPVVQVDWTDAGAYAKWVGKRLPTEAEFEYAARGGLVGKEYAWGNELCPGGKFMANYWQGTFPARNTGDDGFVGRAPIGQFPANGFGLHDMTGNVWQWCADWYDEDYFAHSPRDNLSGPAQGAERVMRGGSFLCAANFCTNYRVAGRMHATPDSALNNVGLRCVRDP
jgi:formylglycine-generating enzyme required for sulfatase activity